MSYYQGSVSRHGYNYWPPSLYGKAKNTNIWNEFPGQPGEIRKLQTIWLKWDIVKKEDKSRLRYRYRDDYESTAFYSLDEGETWCSFCTYADKDKAFYKKIVKEVDVTQAEALRAHNRELARKRREKLKEEAEEAGLTLEEYKAQRSKKIQKKRKDKKDNKEAQKLSKMTNKKMKLASSLKELMDAANILREQLLDGTELSLRYLDNRLHKIDQVTEYLEGWAVRDKKKLQ